MLSVFVCAKVDGYVSFSWKVTLWPFYAGIFIQVVFAAAASFYLLLNVCNQCGEQEEDFDN